MSTLKPELTFLDFDGTYEEQRDLCSRFPHRWVDFRALRQASLYCSLESFSSIERTLVRQGAGPQVTLLGCGNYHFVTLALLERLRRPFSLVLVDHHTDSKEGMLDSMISCGSWIRHALTRLELLERVVMIGPPCEAIAALPESVRRRVLFAPDLSPRQTDRLLASLPESELYLSIDKDALDAASARTNWDQGNLQLKELCAFIEQLEQTKRICGADICGELPASPLDLLRPEVQRAIERNQCANETLLDTLLKAG